MMKPLLTEGCDSVMGPVQYHSDLTGSCEKYIPVILNKIYNLCIPISDPFSETQPWLPGTAVK